MAGTRSPCPFTVAAIQHLEIEFAPHPHLMAQIDALKGKLARLEQEAGTRTIED